MIDFSTGIITTVARNLPGVSFDRDSQGNFYLVLGDSIVKYTASTREVTTIAGQLSNPFGTTSVDLGDGGPATAATLSKPQNVRMDGKGNLYIADTGNRRIRYIDRSTGVITTLAGSAKLGCSTEDGLATHAALTAPVALTVDAEGNVYFADVSCGQLFKVSRGAPAAPKLLSPPNGATLSLFSGNTLEWTSSPGATSYDVAFVPGKNGLLPVVANVTGTAWVFPVVRPGAVYSWQITARNAAGVNRSDVYTFTAGTGCVGSLNVAGLTVGSDGGPGELGVNATSSCTWAATSNSSWIVVSEEGAGSASVHYQVLPNPGFGRSGKISTRTAAEEHLIESGTRGP